ncbi:MAG: hypothetical protein ABSB40_04350 [Nitrososphaeria archaeon]|jgi:TolA-binding protein
MPRKKGDDDELRRRALELRRKGLSYVEIGRQLGRSSYKAWELISPYESHQPKITQVAELDKRIAELNGRINELTKVTDDISAQLKKVKTIKDLSERMSRVDKELTVLKESVDLLQRSASFRVLDFECHKIDKDGFCTFWSWVEEIKGTNMRKSNYEGAVRYQMNVNENPLICTACPKFANRNISLTKT